MAAPTNIKRGKKVLQTSDQCPRCPHLISAHDAARANQCGSCSCVVQDTHGDPRSFEA